MLASPTRIEHDFDSAVFGELILTKLSYFYKYAASPKLKCLLYNEHI